MTDVVNSVLLVEDDATVRIGATQALQLAGFAVQSFARAEAARDAIKPGMPAVLVTDVRLPGMDGLALLEQTRARDPDIPVIIVSGHGDISMAVQAMRAGAYDFIEKPFSSDRLADVVRRAAEKRRLTLEVQALRDKLQHWNGIEATLLGVSPEIEEIRRQILMLAETDVDVLINGETGTGKELVARSLHEHSKRKTGHFVALNCGGLPETLFESEIFGHVAGAFTGAVRARVGKLEWSNKGTLFLDEIESMPLGMQIKLLRVLQERTIERLGSNEVIPIDCRVVSATKVDLKGLAAQEKFRSDLYYRLGVAVIELPPLRHRREDIPILFEHFLLLAGKRFGRPAPILSQTQIGELMAYAWPGNVRELHNVADRFVLGLLGERFQLQKVALEPPAATLAEQVTRFERALIEEELRRNHGNANAASESLGVPKKTLYDKLKRFHLTAEEFRE
ncbi:MAG TPA: sigma-54 dependent transcriptional regulator [Burkholderiaceae bacterium]|nr:sigma-54 dependent transcriptional regulator [Burkholderiaceae bacterium]